MNKICTSIKQSQKLIELGIDINTADMCWCNENDVIAVPYNQACEIVKDIPAWSLSALLGLMPTFTLNGFGNGQFNCRDERANSYTLVDTCPLDAVFEMVCRLKENNEKKELKKIERTPAWSEDDEEKFSFIRAILIDAKNLNNCASNSTYYREVTESIDWLKNLKERVQPQLQWKPSEKQIEALEHFVRSIGESGYASPYDNNTKLLYSLLFDLKNLKG